MTEQQGLIENKDNFIFKGFEPNRFLNAYCKQVYCLVEEKAPCNSTKTASLCKVNNTFEGTIRIVSDSSCTFLVTSSKAEPRMVVEDLYAQFAQKISHWIENRDIEPEHSLNI